MKRLALIFLTLAAPALHGSDDALRGLAGAELAAELRRQYHPVSPAASPVATWWGDGSLAVALVPDSWWYGDVPLDLYNYIGADIGFSAARGDTPPALLAQVTASADGWKVGIASLEGYDYNAWEPAADRRGDLARRLMYMAVMHPQPLWRSYGGMVMADGDWPLLSPQWQTLLLDWAAADPADAREIAEMEAIAAAQGNGNPFIINAGLADWLWGERAGQGYVPDADSERTPLRGTYSRGADAAIDLYSPYIPADAAWTVDGNAVAGTSLPLTGLSTGLHELQYTSAQTGQRGKLKIEVKP